MKRSILRLGTAIALALAAPAPALACECAGLIQSSTQSILTQISSSKFEVLTKLQDVQNQIVQAIGQAAESAEANVKRQIEADKRMHDADNQINRDQSVKENQADAQKRYTVSPSACTSATLGTALAAGAASVQATSKQLSEANKDWSTGASGQASSMGPAGSTGAITDLHKRLQAANIKADDTQASSIFDKDTLTTTKGSGGMSELDIANAYLRVLVDPMPPKPLPKELADTPQGRQILAARMNREGHISLARKIGEEAIARRRDLLPVGQYVRAVTKQSDVPDKVSMHAMLNALTIHFVNNGVAAQSAPPEAIMRDIRDELATIAFLSWQDYRLREMAYLGQSVDNVDKYAGDNLNAAIGSAQGAQVR